MPAFPTSRLSSGASQDEVRRHNLSTLLRHVHVSGSLSRAELTGLMSLNRSTIKGLVAELADAGLVDETIPDRRQGAGRPSHVVVPRTDSCYVLAANVGVDGVELAAVGLGGTMLVSKTYPINGVGSRPSAIATRLARELDALAARTPPGSWAVGVGIGVPGLVRASDGHVEIAPNLQWHNVPFARMVHDRMSLDLDVRVGNDGDLGALAEHIRGVARDVDNAVFIIGEVGVGGGVIVDGRMIVGSSGFAGEIGHMMVNPDGLPCRCGSVGCWETEIGEDAILRAAHLDPGGGQAAVEAVIARAVGGDAAMVGVLEDVGLWIARGVASLINLLNPEVVIFGGILPAVFTVVEDTVREAIARYAMAPSAMHTRLAVPVFGSEASLIGAAELAFERALSNPVEALGRPEGRASAPAAVQHSRRARR